MNGRLSGLAIVALVLAGCLLAQFTFADTTITVTNSDDAGPGTLRQAIADSASGDTIVIALDSGNTITLTNGQLFVTNDLTIVSSNATVAIEAGGNSRALEIASNTVVLDSLTVTNGNASDFGGGILVDEGATLTLTNCTVAGNVAGAGGGIFISGNSAVAINNCLFSGNSATNNGGAIDNETNGTLTIGDSIFTGNSAQAGGAIFNNFATNILDDCAFSGNSAEGGGAIANLDSVLTATRLSVSNNFAAAGGGIFNGNNNSLLTLNSSTLSGNVATNFGGGIINTNGGTATINNSTISSNACPADNGGGIDNLSTITINNCTISGSPSGGGFLDNGGAAVCNNSTFSGNVALFDGGGYYAVVSIDILNNCTISGNSAKRRAGGIYQNSGSLVLTNTIIAGNTAIISSPDLLVGSISGTNNLLGGDPLLAPLGDYGGPTQTMPPLSGSPAINAGIDSVTNLFTTDQRGDARLAGAHVDIGAVEIQPAMVTNTNNDGPGSLRAAAAIEPALIAFTNTLSGQTILLTSGQITLSNNVDIDASSLPGGIAIDAGGASRALEISESNVVTLDSVTITNGNVSENGGGILIDDGVTLTLNHCTVAGNSAAMAGGGIFISSNSFVAVNNCLLSSNSAIGNGGAINNDADSILAVNNSAFSVNSAGSGGAVFNYFGAGLFSDCAFSNNVSTADLGGGICNAGSLAIDTCTLDGNNPGGGIAQSSGILTVEDSTISHNISIQSGGGFAIVGGQATLNNSTVYGNSAGSTNGGGMSIGANATNMLNNCTISGNSASAGGGLFLDSASICILTNTIVAGNTSGDASDIVGPFTGTNNLTNGNPLLAPFGNYGGPTQTMPPLAGSAAIDAGLDSAVSLFTDQRGYPRISGAHVDIGAVEAQLAPANNRPILKLNRTQPGGAWSLTFANFPNIDFTVLSSTNLARPLNQWDILGPAIQNSPGFYQFTDSAATNNRVRFYQVVSP